MPNAIANASYADAVEETGWGYLDLNTSAAFSNYEQVYAAGYVEAYLTQGRIYQVGARQLRKQFVFAPIRSFKKELLARLCIFVP
jgi:hypothetical protein